MGIIINYTFKTVIKKIPTISIYITLSVLFFVLGFKSREFYDHRRVIQLAELNNQEEAIVKKKVNFLPEVKAFMAKGGDRYVWIESVTDRFVSIHVYEYLGNRTTKTFGRYEYNRITGELVQVY